MNSSTLKEKGFSEFVPLKTLTFPNLPTKNCVLVLADCSLSGKPASDIIYIGKSKKPAKRIFGGYLAGYGGKTTRKISALLLDDGYIEKVAVSWMQSDNSKTAQQKLLADFKKEHGAYPVWNTQKKTPQKAKPAPKKVNKTSSAKQAKPVQ